MAHANDIDMKITQARDYAKRCLKDNFDYASKDDYFMFLISKFVLLKESMIEKNFQEKKLYFDIETNYQYLKAIVYIVNYVREHGTLISNNLEVVILPPSYHASNKLKSYIRDFHKIRDTFSHGQYHIDSENECIVLDNDNLIEGNPPTRDTYVIRGILPIEVLEVFTYIFESPKNIYPKESIDEFKNKTEKNRKKYGYHSNFDNANKVFSALKKYNEIQLNIPKQDHKTIDFSGMYNDKSKIYNNMSYNYEKLKISNDYNKYKEENTNFYIKAKEKEEILNTILKELASTPSLTPKQKEQLLAYLKEKGLIDINVNLDNISIKSNPKPNKKYIEKLAMVINEISSIMHMKTNPGDTIKIASVYNYMQLFLSFKHDTINPVIKANLGKLRISKLNPRYHEGKRQDYDNIVQSIRKYVKEKIIDEFKDQTDENDNIIKEGQITKYLKHPSPSFRDSLNTILKNHYEKILTLLASRNIEIITSIRNSLEHGNIEENAGNIRLQDFSNQHDPTSQNFECHGSPHAFYEIISNIDLDQNNDFTFDDFVIEMEDVLGEDLYKEFKEIIDNIKKINTEALISTLRQVTAKK